MAAPAQAGAVGGRLTWWDASSRRIRSTASGTATAPRSSPTRGSCTWIACSTSGSRRIIGFALGEHHDTDLAYLALAMAVAVRGGREAISGVIFHTDQGSEYTAHRFRAACHRMRIRQSMGRPGSALDNAVIESWHSTLEFELRSLEHFATKTQARARVAAWIDDYNRDRRHSALQMRSPIGYEQASTPARRQHDLPPDPTGWRRPRRGQGQALRVAYDQP